MTSFKYVVLLVCLLCLLIPGIAFGNTVDKASPQTPIDSWTYPALEKVVSLYRVKSDLTSLRPLTRLEAASLILKASLREELYSIPLQAKMLLRRLKKEFAEEMTYLQETEGKSQNVEANPIRKVELSYNYRDGLDALYTGTDAHQFPLVYNNSGHRYALDSNGTFTLLGDINFYDTLLISWQPRLTYDEDDDFQADLVTGTIALNIKGVELSVGRQSLWWGPGRHGSLLLTNNAEPLDMLRLTNPSPNVLPWIFKYLGPFRFDLFISELDDYRVVPEPYFGGLRFDFKPFNWLEFGMARTVMFGGDGRPSGDFSDFLTIIGGQNLSGNEDTSNSIAGIDARLIFEHLGAAEIYGELYGEDEADMLPSKNSWLGGLYLPQVDPSGYVSMRIEYADTTRIGGVTPVLYRHGIYKSGYIHKGQIIGHHVGSDATDLSLDLRIDISERLTVGVLLDYEQRGKSLADQEKHRQVQLSTEFWLTPQLLLNALYTYDDVENWNFTVEDEELHLASVGLEYSW